jgi:SpoVK/Ycf46/Vps4 family AAA+-type ATPase
VAPIVVECGQHVLQRDLLAPVGAAATLLASGVGDDRVDPRAERGLASEQVDLPDHTPESVLDRLLGVWGVPGDSEGQTIRASAIRLDEKLGRTGLAPAQRPVEPRIAIATLRRRSRGAGIGGVPAAMRGRALISVSISSPPLPREQCISSDVESTIVPHLLAEIDGVEGLKNVIVIGASNRQDLIDPAILRPGRLDVKIKVERPDEAGASDIFHKYLTTQIPIAAGESIDSMIAATVQAMYALSENNRFLEVTYADGEKEVLYFKDFSSGAMIESIVRRAKTLAVKHHIRGGNKGISPDDLLTGVREEFRENEDLPNTTNPDDWARIAGKKGERIVHVKLLTGGNKAMPRDVQTVHPTGQYL